MNNTTTADTYYHYLIRVPTHGKQTAAETENFLADLHRLLISQTRYLSHPTLALELFVINQFIHFAISVPAAVSDFVLGQLYVNFPDIEIDKIQDYTQCIPDSLEIASCELRLERKDIYPILTYKNMGQESLSALSGLGTKTTDGEQLWMQIIIQPINENWREDLTLYMKRLIRWQMEPIGAKEAIDHKFEKLYYQSTVRVACLSTTQYAARARLEAFVHSFEQFDNGSINGFRRTKITTDTEVIPRFQNREKGKYSYILNVEELASLYHLPGRDMPVANVVQVLSRKAEPPPELPETGLLKDDDVSTFAVTNFRNHCQPFGLKRIDRRKHVYVIGKTGMGKSKLLELLMLSDIYQGKGFAVLDPHGDLAEEILRYIPKGRIRDVIYFNPADEEYPIGFNPLQSYGKAYHQHIVAGFIGIFKKLFAFEWTPRLEHMLRYTTLALLDTEGATVVGIVQLLTNKTYRQEVIAHIQDPVVKNFWTHEFATWNEKFDNEAIVPLLNKVGEFISSPLIRNCLGQKKSSFMINDVIEHNKILILNLSSGRLGEENSALLGSMVVTQIQQAAMARTMLPEEKRKDFYLYVDEFQNFATSAFATILSEARKYRLCLAMAHQYIGQLNEEIQKTVFGNIGSLISFRVGSNDAKFLETEFAPVFTSDDLQNLDARNICLKISIDGKTAPAFSAQTIRLPRATEDHSLEIVQYCRQTYARPRTLVEAEIENGESEKQETMSPTPHFAQSKQIFEEPIV